MGVILRVNLDLSYTTSLIECQSYMCIYVYNGLDEVPEDVTHVRVDHSVTVIPEGAFREYLKLEEVELPRG